MHYTQEPARDRYCREVNNVIKTVEPKALKHTLTTVKKLGKQLKRNDGYTIASFVAKQRFDNVIT